MACYSPLEAFQLDTGEVVFRETKKVLRELSLPCGQCVGCRLERSRQWAVRCLHETQMHESSSFVTLTYNDEHLPEYGCLRYRDFQLFMKRLRKVFPEARFFMCGEYGERTGRPHYHACLFGVWFHDRKFWKTSPSGFKLYRSELMERLWPHGDADIGDMSFESAGYVARYCMKKVTGALADNHYRRFVPDTGEVYWLVPEFARMSLKPGIGAKWFEKFRQEVINNDGVAIRGKICRPPRYYDVLANWSALEGSEIEFSRQMKAIAAADDNSPDRLRAREIVTHARIKSYERTKVE